MKAQLAIDKLIVALHTQAVYAPGLVLPVSGGSDGALAFWLGAKAFPGRMIGLHFGDNLRGREWFESLGQIDYLSLPDSEIGAEELRWASTLSYCRTRNFFWPVGSRNRTEDALRTYSRSSTVATILPIVGVFKSDVIKLCEHIGVPAEIIASSRRPDPPCGRPTELADIGIERIDIFVRCHLGLDPIERMSKLSEPEIVYLTQLCGETAFKAQIPHRGPNVELD